MREVPLKRAPSDWGCVHLAKQLRTSAFACVRPRSTGPTPLPWKGRFQSAASKWMYIWGSSERIYFVPLIPLHL